MGRGRTADLVISVNGEEFRMPVPDEEALMSLPRLVRHPSDRYVIPPLTRTQRVRFWLARRIRDLAVAVGPFDGPDRPCECPEQHPHPDWPA